MGKKNIKESERKNIKEIISERINEGINVAQVERIERTARLTRLRCLELAIRDVAPNTIVPTEDMLVKAKAYYDFIVGKSK